MLKPKVKRSTATATAATAGAGRSADPTPATSGQGRVKRPQNAPPRPNESARATTASPGAPNGGAALGAGLIKTDSGLDLTEKIRELVSLAKEQGHLTYDDINEVLPETVVTAADLDQIYAKLAGLEIEIVDQAEVDRVKQPEAEEEEKDKGRLDILDDPVRMYLRQMGKVPLLTREQEVAIC